MLDEIKKIYEENIQWLNFAELKNGALLTVSLAVLGVVSQTDIILYLKCILMICFSLLSLICMASFIPFLNQSKWIKEQARRKYAKKYGSSLQDHNIIFYVNIFLSNTNDYKLALSDIINNGQAYDFKKLEENYILQLFQISTISAIKYYFFNFAVKVFFAFVIVLVVSIIIA